MPRKYLEGKVTYVGISLVESMSSTTLLLVAKFQDRHGNIYSWAPKWTDLVSIVEEAKAIEKLNSKANRERAAGFWITNLQHSRTHNVYVLFLLSSIIQIYV